MQELLEYIKLLKEKTDLMVEVDVGQSKQLELLGMAINALHSLHNISTERIERLESIIANLKRPALHTNN